MSRSARKIANLLQAQSAIGGDQHSIDKLAEDLYWEGRVIGSGIRDELLSDGFQKSAANPFKSTYEYLRTIPQTFAGGYRAARNAPKGRLRSAYAGARSLSKGQLATALGLGAAGAGGVGYGGYKAYRHFRPRPVQQEEEQYSE